MFGEFLGQAAGNMLGSVIDNGFMEEDRNQQQEWVRGMHHADKQWMEKMSNSAYQRATRDMAAAGLNPMLAYSQGGASSPSVGTPSSPGGKAPGLTGAMSGTLASAAHAHVANAQAKHLEASADKERAEEAEIRARTPTHAWTREKMAQEINESKQRVEKMMSEVNLINQQERSSAASMFKTYQEIDNLRAEIPKIQAFTQNLRAQVDLMGSQDAEIRQRIKANLPALEAALKEVDAKSKLLAIPKQAMDAATHSSFVGALSALMRALNPLVGIVAVTK